MKSMFQGDLHVRTFHLVKSLKPFKSTIYKIVQYSSNRNVTVLNKNKYTKYYNMIQASISTIVKKKIESKY